MTATDDDTLLPFSLPNICKKKVSCAFDGGTISSDGGVFLLAAADKGLGLIDALAALIHPPSWDPRSHELAVEAARAHPPSSPFWDIYRRTRRKVVP